MAIELPSRGGYPRKPNRPYRGTIHIFGLPWPLSDTPTAGVSYLRGKGPGMYEAMMARFAAASGETVETPESWGNLPGLLYIRPVGVEDNGKMMASE